MFDDILLWIENNSIRGLGVLLTVVALTLTISELRVYLRHKSSSDQLILWLCATTAGIVTIMFEDMILGILTGLLLLMIIETKKMWDTPVWGKLIATTTITYFVIWVGSAGQTWYNWYYHPETPNEQILSNAYHLAFPIFIIVSFIFFGRKFILVSRFSSPQIVYLFLFAMVYTFLNVIRKVAFPNATSIQAWNYLGISGEWPTRVIFATFGTYELLAIVMVVIYFFSGRMLSFLMGVRPVEDEELLAKVKEIAKTMGIENNVKVGYLKAPILNAFAYGPWFDKRIAFISNDIDEFNDSDIRGIVGHELAHAARHHVVILTVLSIFELAFKKLIHFPATSLDYSFDADAATQEITFWNYYLFSYLILIFLLIVVRMLEGDADKATKDAGFGEDLGKALFRLEGFYNGVAAEAGISANLLTDRTYSLQEKRRFTAMAARNLYKDLLSASRIGALGNIFQSHPKTVYRIAAIVNPEYNPRRMAFLPYRLLGFFLRKGAMKQLANVSQKYAQIIDSTYLDDYGLEGLGEVMEYNPWSEIYEQYLGQEIIAFDELNNEVVIGKLEEIKRTDRVTSPVIGIVEGYEIDFMVSSINWYEKDGRYFLKNGDIVTLEDYKLNEEKKLMFQVMSHGEQVEVEFKKIGVPTRYVEELRDHQVVFYHEGISRLGTITNLEINGSWKSSHLQIDDLEIDGSQVVVGFSPIGFETRKSMKELQQELLKSLVGKKVKIYTKDNLDVSLAGKVKSVDLDELVLEDADGEQKLLVNRLEYFVAPIQTVELILKDHISLYTKLNIWWANRTKFEYINP